MKKAAWCLGFLLAAPLAAQSFELGVFAGQQSYKSYSLVADPANSVSVSIDSKTVYGARFGYSVVDFGPALFQLTAGYQPESTATGKSTIVLGGTPVYSQGDYKEGHWSVGAMFNFKALVAIGAGVEFRSESLKTDTDSTTYNRPWARFNVGYAFPTPLVKPFIGVEADFPLTSKSNETGSTADMLKSLAPKAQIGVYGGIRF